jgi:hypothetical protein
MSAGLLDQKDCRRVGLNTAERTKEYLNERLEVFRRLQDLRNAKEDFFPAVRRFQQTTVAYLRNTGIIDHTQLDKLDSLLTEIDIYKTKGFGDEVYWSRVGPPFNKVILTIDELKGLMDEVEIPFHLRIRDYLFDRSLTEKIVGGVIVALIVLFIKYVISLLF